jgi:hypothetical protein
MSLRRGPRRLRAGNLGTSKNGLLEFDVIAGKDFLFA